MDRFGRCVLGLWMCPSRQARSLHSRGQIREMDSRHHEIQLMGRVIIESFPPLDKYKR